ncbi:GNAT family N-acetyltransferase [Flavobacterium sp. ZT3R18]|uniref:GNAT family N-acetyltransferase n=1 Tax=Flavobacterium sp. ZT3R18 TaxID=2594429 RepID=UPI00117A6557|nr:GNAT family N-acetyltransferase [Flavobacterium sp. ZT3R18]TRX37386.1 GNAT family N-acetyltransferase [Flavobacterium sp. ZT3R18]
MNEKITNNLFEFWSYIGQQNNIYTDSSNYKAVSVLGSDWPKRIYSIEDKKATYDEVLQLSNQDLLPNIITLDEDKALTIRGKTQLLFAQTNMSLDLKNYTSENVKNTGIHQIETKTEAFEFATIASQSFGYTVDGEIIYNICKDSSRVKNFIFKDKEKSYGCGIVFFDTDNNAGFHMIGTIPDGRGKGIAKSITERLIDEALINNCNYCVLNASKMGEPTYERLGFTSFGTLENHIILK